MSKDINDYLHKDTITIPKQEFAIISVISPKSNQKHDKIALKIKGVFESEELARAHAVKLQRANDLFDLYVVEMYAWLFLPPETDIEKHYGNEKLEELIQSHIKVQEDAKIEFEKYKKEQLENSILQKEKEVEVEEKEE